MRPRARAVAVWIAAVAALAAPGARADEPNAPASPFGLELRASGFYGPVDGYVQVPLGGNPGSSSARRPTLHELGIDDAASWEVNGRFSWGHFTAFGGYWGLELSGSSTLSQPLVSHGVAFAAGQSTRSTVDLNVPNFGAGWRFDFDERKLELLPKIDVALLDFSYSLDAAGAHASRSYTTTAVRLGAEARYKLPAGFGLEFDGVFSLPISHMPQLASVVGRVTYALFPSAPVRPTLFLGLGGRWIDFKDSQTLPNHIDLASGPLLTFGITLAY